VQYAQDVQLGQHPSLVFLTCRDKAELEELKRLLHSHDIGTAEFHEPYKDWGLTAISCLLTEDQRHRLKGFPLWRLPSQGQSK
jgi:hypothetical protein